MKSTLTNQAEKIQARTRQNYVEQNTPIVPDSNSITLPGETLKPPFQENNQTWFIFFIAIPSHFLLKGFQFKLL